MPLAPEYAAMFKQLADGEPTPPLWELRPQEGRDMYRAARAVIEELPIGKIINEIIAGPLGDIPVRIYFPSGEGPFGTLLYFHGGGWVIGDLDTGDAVCREIAMLANLVVVSVAYRMAPENIYPAAVDDSYAALEWASTNKILLKGNDKIGVSGESAGGNLSAVVSLKSRDQNGPKIDFQCLLYPVTDHDLARPSYSSNGEGFLLETKSMEWFWDIYCPDSKKRGEPYASPLRSGSLSDLPKALVVTAEFDPLRDEGKAYSDALSEAGVDVTYRCYDGMVHDFFSTAVIFDSSRKGFLETIASLKAELN